MINFNITGVTETMAKLSQLGEEGTRIGLASVSAVSDMIVAEAKASAPADLGGIRQGIVKEQLNEVQYTVKATAPESAYQEFGTGGKVDVPAEMSDIASEFQGRGGGDFQAFVLALTDWVKRHGGAYGASYSVATHRRVGSKSANYDADQQAADLIARSILKNGLKPQPYLYPAFVNNAPKLLPMLETALKELLAK